MNCQINNNSNMNVQDLNPLISDLASAVQQKVGFKSMPNITLQDDEDNADAILGKTAYYDPQNKAVTVYVTNRHPKDILRSIAHELIHHGQNLRGEFDKIGAVGEGYAQNDEHLRNMEKEAYLQGNMCFRDWEDGHKRQMMESIHRQNSFKRRNNTMKKYKSDKNNELNKLLMEKFNLGNNTLNEAHCSGNRDDEEKEETMEEAHCMGQGNRGDKPCPECGKKNCPGKDGDKKIDEAHCAGNRDDDSDDKKEGKKDEEQLYRYKNGKIVPVSKEFMAGRKVRKKVMKLLGLDESIDSLDEELENPEKADLDKDGELSGYEKKRGKAIEKSMKDQDKKKNESYRRQVRKMMEEILKLK